MVGHNYVVNSINLLRLCIGLKEGTLPVDKLAILPTPGQKLCLSKMSVAMWNFCGK